MASNRRRSTKSLGKVVTNMQSRLRFVQKRPAPRRVGRRVVSSANIKKDAVTPVELAPDSVTPEALAPNAVTADAIAPGTITNEELAPGTGGNDTSYSGSAPASPSIGDVWFDTGDSLKLKRWDGTNWVSMRDLGIAAAQAGADAASTAATAAQTTANSKNKVYRQTSEPTGGTYAEGDLWFDTDDNNKIYRRTSSAWTAVQLGGEALANINANKITAGTIDASVITVSNLDAGNITAGTIAASRITSTSISAADITAAQITSGEISSARITSTSISAAEINADNITAGTITSRAINNGNGTFTVDASGNLSASSASITGTISASSGTIGGYFINGSALYSATIALQSGSIQVNQGNESGYCGLGGSESRFNKVGFQNQSVSGWDTNFYPYNDGGGSLGISGTYRWNNVNYLGSLNDQSDERTKTSIASLPSMLPLIDSLNPVSYLKKISYGDSKVLQNDEDRENNTSEDPRPGVRRHFGLIAQEVRSAMNANGFDVNEYSGWGMTDKDDPESEQMLMYLEFIGILLKGVQELSQRVSALENAI